MTARNRPPRRRPDTFSVADALRDHIALTKEHRALMHDVAELRDAGKIAAARHLMKKTEKVYGQLEALERKMRQVGPGD